MIRNTISTEGKQVSFKIDDNYYLPNSDNRLVFNGHFKNMRYCVCYTNVYRDSGHRFENRFGCPAWVKYDNGAFGGQNFNFYNNKDEAIEDYKSRQKLSAKYGKNTFAYADVFFVENDC
jgi:hypothetical protein